MPRQRKDVPWLDTRDNGVFYAFWYNPDLARVEKESLKTRDAGEAARAFGKFLIEGPRSARADELLGITVHQALDDYEREHVDSVDDKGRPNVADATRQKNSIVHLKAYFAADIVLKSIGPLESRAYTEARRRGEVGGGKRRKDKRGADSTIRRELNALVAAANHAVKWKRLLLTEMPTIELPREDRHAAETPWLTEKQLKDAFDKARDLGMESKATETQKKLYDFMMLAYYTAARRRSIEGLTKFQVNLETGTINLMPPNKKPTKKRQPVVPIFPEIRTIVERLMQTPGTLLFGGRYDFYRQFVWLLEGMGIVGWPHILRHSRATHLLLAGERPYKVARLLGDTPATLDRVYAHALPDDLRELGKKPETKEKTA